jgi:hypothetical protein
MASKLSAVLFVVFAASFMLASVVPFVSASSFFDRTYEGRGIGKAFSVVQTGDGGYALIGYTQNTSDYSSVCWLVKTDPDGNMEWNKTYGELKSDYAHSVVQTSDDGYAIAGAKEQTNMLYTTMWLVKTDSSGNMEWNQTYGYGSANSVIQTSDGGYAMTGYKIEGFPIFCLVKTDEAGIIPEFSSWTILPLLLIATLLIILCKHRLPKTPNNEQLY